MSLLELLCIAFNSLGTVIKGPRGLKISSHKEKRSTFLWFFEILYLIWAFYGLVLRKGIYQHDGLVFVSQPWDQSSFSQQSNLFYICMYCSKYKCCKIEFAFKRDNSSDWDKKWCFFSMSKKCFLIRLTANERSKQTIKNKAKVNKLEKILACFQHYFVYNSYTRVMRSLLTLLPPQISLSAN